VVKMSIDLRFSNIDPPAPEPPRSIYADLVNLPDPVYLGLTVRMFNYDAVGLYMRVDAYKAGWTFTSNDFGLLASGGNMYRNIDNFGYRTKPASATTETITVRLRAYTDAGYTNLKWTFERVIDIIFIKSDDGSWTQDVLNNFDDGTAQGWAVANETGNDGAYPIIEVRTDYVLSTPYSVRMFSRWTTNLKEVRSRLYKSFTTADRNYVFAIINIRQGFDDPAATYTKYLQVQRDSTVLVFLGRPFDTSMALGDYTPENKWMRIVVPLPRNTAVEIRLIQDVYAGSATHYGYLWQDDFMIISKD